MQQVAYFCPNNEWMWYGRASKIVQSTKSSCFFILRFMEIKREDSRNKSS